MFVILDLVTFQEHQIGTVRKLLFKDHRTKLADETREQLAFLTKGHPTLGEPAAHTGNIQLSAIPEVNSTGKPTLRLLCIC